MRTNTMNSSCLRESFLVSCSFGAVSELYSSVYSFPISEIHLFKEGSWKLEEEKLLKDMKSVMEYVSVTLDL